MSDVNELVQNRTTEVRDVIEAYFGRGRPYAAVILIQVVCNDGETIAWKAKAKRGRALIAKCCPTLTHWTPAEALEELLTSTCKALGVRP